MIEQDDEGRKVLVPGLIRYATEEDQQNVSYAFSGDRCIEQFIHATDNLTEVDEEDKHRDLIVIFNDLKGFDGNFEELYHQRIKVETQLTTGAKTLKFNYSYMDAKITFKDSLCFLPMPLADLSETCHLVELHKGWFPHAFHTRENLTYRGSISAKQYFQPQAMKKQKREEFDSRYAAELERNEEYVLWDKLNKYCHSDVMVLKAACLKFIQELNDEAGFNPIETYATIASACNLFWRRDLIPEDTIAIEPLNGWRGANVNKSKAALEWLC